MKLIKVEEEKAIAIRKSQKGSYIQPANSNQETYDRWCKVSVNRGDASPTSTNSLFVKRMSPQKVRKKRDKFVLPL